MNKIWLALLVSLTCIFASVQAHAMGEEEKIAQLIESVKSVPEGTQFIRNGSAYPAADAAAHLRMKYSKVQSKVKTAEDFIKYVASKSSVSGQAYVIRYPDGTTVTAEVFFTEKLRRMQNAKQE